MQLGAFGACGAYGAFCCTDSVQPGADLHGADWIAEFVCDLTLSFVVCDLILADFDFDPECITDLFRI